MILGRAEFDVRNRVWFDAEAGYVLTRAGYGGAIQYDLIGRGGVWGICFDGLIRIVGGYCTR